MRVLPRLEQVTRPGGRFYVTPAGNFPSVTTILSHHKRDVIAKWREDVGDEEADRIMKRAAMRGTILHKLMETHFGQKQMDATNVSPFYLSLFLPIRDYLHDVLKDLWHVEVALFSEKLKAAGTTDVIGIFEDGEPEILDFKTSMRAKREEWTDSYFLQASAYAYMYHELTGIHINKLRIIVISEYGELQVFKGTMEDHINDFAKARVQFYKDKGY